MKKRVLSLIMALTMVSTTFLGMNSTVQASRDETILTSIKTKKGFESVEAQSDSFDIKGISDYESTAVKVKRILTSETAKASKVNYLIEEKQYVLAPVTPNHTGLLYFDYDVFGKGYAEVYLLESCRVVDGQIGGEGYYLTDYYGGDRENDDGGVPVTAGKKYWLYIVNISQDKLSVNVRGNIYSTLTTRSLSEGTSKWTIASGWTEDENPKATTIYYRIKPSKTGYITVDVKSYDEYNRTNASLTLYDKNKDKISNAVAYESGNKGTDGKAYFGVEKGKTYYLKVAKCGYKYLEELDPAYKYGIRYAVTSAKDRAIGTKSSAKTIVRKADATKTLFKANGTTETDWYKFKVTSKRKTQIKIDTSRIKSGNVSVTFYKDNKKLASSNTITSKYNDKTYTITQATAGTYYVKVVKSKNATGLYTIRYVQ